MSVVDKIKNLVMKMGTKGKIISLTVLAVGNIASVVSISVAWFSLGGGGANIDMVSGDLNVEIRKVTACMVLICVILRIAKAPQLNEF